MQTIFEDLRDCISAFLYDNDEYVLKNFYSILKNDKNKQLNDEFNNYYNLAGDNYKFYCMIIILMLTSDYYEYCKYKEDENDYTKWLDNDQITFDKVIARFMVDEKYAIELLSICFDYSKFLDDIVAVSCMDNILQNKAFKKQIVKINPYVCLEYLNKYELEDFEEEDIINYYFLETYKKCENEEYLDNEMYDVDLVDDQDMKIAESIKETIVNKLAQFYHDDDKVIKALQFIIYDTFRRVMKYSRNILEINEISNIVIEYINNPVDIVNLFIYDSDFLKEFIEWYSYYTLYKFLDDEPDVLLINQVNTLTLLKKFNPFNGRNDKDDGN